MEDEEFIEPEAEDEGGELLPRQQLFCELYAGDREFFGNGVQSYIEAYEPDQSKKNWYNSAAASASRLLRNVKVITKINNLLEIGGLNDVAVDKQLSFLIAQHADFGSKVQAIREYNKLKQRIIDKTDITTGGDKFATTGVEAEQINAFNAWSKQQTKKKKK